MRMGKRLQSSFLLVAQEYLSTLDRADDAPMDSADTRHGAFLALVLEEVLARQS